MDFSLTTIFVKPVGVALATSGASSALTAGQIGIYNKGLQSVASGSSTEFVIAQGRHPNEVPQTTKKSDLIRRSAIIRYRKNAAITTAQQKQITVSGFTAKCGEEVSLTIRAFSKYLNVGYSNGLTKTFLVHTPCCECGDDPCEEVDKELLIDEFVAQINASQLGEFVLAEKDEVLDENEDPIDYVLVLTGKELQQDPIAASLNNFVYDGYDVVDFYVYATKEPETTVDNYVDKRCDEFATVETTQKIVLPMGSYAEVRQLEKRYYSYQTGILKTVNCDPDANPVYASNAVPGTFYDEYIITFRSPQGSLRWEDNYDIDETVRIFVAVSESSAFATALNAIVGSTSIETEY